MIVSTLVSMVKKENLFGYINGGVLSIIIYVIDPAYWWISICLLLITYLFQFIEIQFPKR